MYRLSRNVPTLLSLPKIIECGSINKASEALHISQPALTRSIARLEQVLGVPLLERVAKGVRATVFGEMALAHARMIETELRGALQDIAAALKTTQVRALRIGATPLVSSYFLATGLQAIYVEFPDLPVRLSEGSRPGLLGQLRRNELDMVFSTFPFESQEPDLLQEPLFELDLRVVVRASHPLASCSKLTLRDFARYRWILPRADSGLYGRVERDFQRADVAFPGSYIETSSPETARSLIASTDLIGILPARAITTPFARGNLVPLSGEWSFAQRTVGMFVLEGQSDAPACKALVRALRTH